MNALELTKEQLRKIDEKAEAFRAYLAASVTKMKALQFKDDDQLLEATLMALAALEAYRAVTMTLLRRRRYLETGLTKLHERIQRRERMKAEGDDWPEFPDFE